MMNKLIVIGIVAAAAVLIPVAAFAIIENEAQLLVDAGMEQFEIAIKADILQEDIPQKIVDFDAGS